MDGGVVVHLLREIAEMVFPLSAMLAWEDYVDCWIRVEVVDSCKEVDWLD